jgi:hypothetical protein
MTSATIDTTIRKGEYDLALPEDFVSGKGWQNYPIINTDLNISLCFCRDDQFAVKLDVQQICQDSWGDKRYCSVLDNFGNWHSIGWQEIIGQDVRSY